MKRILAWAALLLLAACAQQPPQPSQFTFAWPLGEETLKPRGGTTRGAAVTLETAPSAAWQELRAAGDLRKRERDRKAILAMAGPYRVSFDFLEVVRYDPRLEADAPFQSWGTEYIFVAEDAQDFVALQHILVMRFAGKDGKPGEPIVVRHWRQEWRYEPQRYLAYEGANTWALRELPAAERRGAWVQSVLQVDDSPRYAAPGRWAHSDGFSSWLSAQTWRPLPRREFSVRSDYQVLVGTNRHTIVPSGWVQEENNLKLALENGKPRPKLPYVGREYGVARYERVRGYDFGPGREYFERTEPFWSEVRAAWRRIAEREGRFTLKAQSDRGQLFSPFFEYAAKLAAGAPFDREAARTFIERTLRERYLASARPDR